MTLRNDILALQLSVIMIFIDFLSNFIENHECLVLLHWLKRDNKTHNPVKVKLVRWSYAIR